MYRETCSRLIIRGMTLALTFIMMGFGVRAQDDTGILAMFWNLENFFDYKDGGANPSDTEFSPEGSRHWTSGRFYAKSKAISKSVWWIADRYGRLPDIIGVAEVENRDVLARLLHSTSLDKAGYSIVHYDSPDRRGIDVALLWRKETMMLESSGVCRVNGLQTRDILVSGLKCRRDGSELGCVVVHLPSKYGGGRTAWKRRLAAERLRAAADSIYASGKQNIIVMGDFNDVPSAREYNVLRPLLVNAADSLASDGEGSIRIGGKWSLIDMFWTTEFLSCRSEMDIVRIPFLMMRDNAMGGEKPLRTYSGPRYMGGVSDHCPVVLKVADMASEPVN